MADQPAPVVQVRNLTKYYGSILGVEGVSFHVNPGEIVGFLGPNGSGKTTVMRMIMGLIRPTAGEIDVFGRPVGPRDFEYRSKIGYLPGNFGRHRHMTVDEFLTFLGNMRSLVDVGRKKELIDRLDINPAAAIVGLSKGNQQKIGVVQALMHSPDVLLLDEPTSGLDPFVQVEFEALLREEQQRGVAIVLSSHVMTEVDQLANRIIILQKGQLALDGDLRELKNQLSRRVKLIFSQEVPIEHFTDVPGVRHVQRIGRDIECEVAGSELALLRVAVSHDVEAVFSDEPTLEDIFLSQSENSQ